MKAKIYDFAAGRGQHQRPGRPAPEVPAIVKPFGNAAKPHRYQFSEGEVAELNKMLGIFRENGVLTGCVGEDRLVAERPMSLINFYNDTPGATVTDIVLTKVSNVAAPPTYFCEYFYYRGGRPVDQSAEFGSFTGLMRFLDYQSRAVFGTREKPEAQAAAETPAETKPKEAEIFRPDFTARHAPASEGEGHGPASISKLPGVDIVLPGEERQAHFTRAELDELSDRLEEGRITGIFTRGLIKYQEENNQTLYAFLRDAPGAIPAMPLALAKRMDGEGEDAQALYTLRRLPGLVEGEGPDVKEDLETRSFEEACNRITDILAETHARTYNLERERVQEWKQAAKPAGLKVDFLEAAAARGHDFSAKITPDQRNSVRDGVYDFGASIAHRRPIFTPEELHAISVKVQEGRSEGLFGEMTRSRFGMVDSVTLMDRAGAPVMVIEKDFSASEPEYRVTGADPATDVKAALDALATYIRENKPAQAAAPKPEAAPVPGV